MVAVLPYRSVGESPDGSSKTHPNLHFLTGKSTMSVISQSFCVAYFCLLIDCACSLNEYGNFPL